MSLADEARDNAIHCEMVKYAYRQSKDGVVVSFVVHPNDIPAALSTSHIGSRYMVALVQVGDDERPIPQTEKGKAKISAAKLQPDTPDKPRSAGARRPWNEMLPSAAAAVRGNDAVFRAFLNEERGYQVQNHTDAAEAVREICKVKSRRDLNIEGSNGMLMWQLLDSAYQAWLAKERVGV